MKQNVNPIKKTPIIIICFFFLLFSIPFSFTFAAQPLLRIEIPSSPNPVGSGARALGMGSAFIAIADDATAASWNPGGLSQLKNQEISFVGTAFRRIEDNDFGTTPEACGSQSVSKSSINYLSAAYPFTLWDRNMIVALNYQNLFDFSRHWNFPFLLNSDTLTLNLNIDYQQEGRLSAYGIAYCLQITPKVSFGVTLNIWEDGLYQNEWKQKSYLKGSGTIKGHAFPYEYHSIERFSFSGLNCNLGTLWHINDHLTIGTVLKTPFEADLQHEFESSNSSVPSSQEEKLDMPMSYGIGFAYRFSDEFSASVDIYRTEWGKFILTDQNGNRTSPLSGQSAGKSDIDPTHQIRIGAEYLFITSKYIIPFRGGIFYDPAPAEGDPDDYFGFSLGSGISVGRFIFDIAYQYRFGNSVGAYILQDFDFSQDIDEHMVYSSMIIHF